MDRLKLSPRSRGLVQTLVVITAVVSLASMLRYVEPTRVIDVLGRADLARLGLLVPLVLAASFGLRAARFRALLDPNDAQRISWLHVLVGVVLGQGANNVLPLRAGELVRTRDLVARGLPLKRVALAQVIEKVVEVVSLLAWVVLVATPWRVAWFSEGAIFLLFVAWLFLTLRHRRNQAVLAEGSSRLGSAVQALVWSIFADGSEVALIAVCLASIGIHPSLATSVAVLTSVNLAISLPSTPGQLGTFEAGASLGLAFAGAPHDVAVGFALLYRIVQWVPVTLLAGLVWLSRSPGTKSRPGSLQERNS